jgi:hypothetical protein
VTSLKEKCISAYILSLDGKPRNQELVPQLQSIGVTTILISGTTVDKSETYLHSVNRSRIRSAKMNKFELACAYGHHEMYRRALEAHEVVAFFFEDDAVIDAEELRSFLEKLPKISKRIILLGSCGGVAFRKSLRLMPGVHRILENMVSGSHAYLADEAAIKILYARSKSLNNFADRFPRNRSVKLLVTYPFISHQIKGIPPEITREDGLDNRSNFIRILAQIMYDFIDYLKFGFLSGRAINNLIKKEIFLRYFIHLPGCRD